MPLQETSGTASYDAFGGGVVAEPNYIESCFSTWLYTGNGSTQTITNGIDLAGKGGLVWTKIRSAADRNALIDSARGINKLLNSDATFAQATQSNMITALTATGYTLGTDGTGQTNLNNATDASWTFRKQPKFFDVVTYTGNGNTGSGQQIAHNLGSTPGCIIIKATSTTGNWLVYHRSTPSAGGAGPGAIYLNTTAASSTTNSAIGFATNTVFSVGEGTAITAANTNGVTYVAYLFAHNAGGFGLTGTDNVISCGSYTGTGAAGLNVTLGYEPQLVLIKNASVGGAGYDWYMIDTMRGWPNSTATGYRRLQPNSSAAEDDGGAIIAPTATGFTFLDWTAGLNQSGNTYIYVAIRRGPMKVPTTGTSVFKPTAYTGNGTSQTITAGFPIDLSMTRIRAAATGQTLVVDRLRGASQRLFTDSTTAESTSTGAVTSLASNTSITFGSNGDTNSSGQTYVTWDFQRAPGFFDEVCYTGTGSATTFNHNLGVTPEMMIVKNRTAVGAYYWEVYHSALGPTQTILLNLTDPASTSTSRWNSTAPTSTVFTVGTSTTTNMSGASLVNYLFASCPGVSKVGSYTGTGATLTISCGFAARFVLIKRTDSTGNWFVWDTARGMVAGTDPRLALNSTAAETNANWVYTNASGFQIVTTDASVNASGGSYIYLAIA